MPGMRDMAGAEAAARKMAEMGGGMPELPPELAAAAGGAGGPEMGGDPMMLIDQLAASFEGAPEDVANEARTHLNAIRELLTQGDMAAAPVEEEAAPAESEVPPAEMKEV